MQKNNLIHTYILGGLLMVSACVTSVPPASRSVLSRHTYYQNLQTTSFFNSPQKISIFEVPENERQTKIWGFLIVEKLP